MIKLSTQSIFLLGTIFILAACVPQRSIPEPTGDQKGEVMATAVVPTTVATPTKTPVPEITDAATPQSETLEISSSVEPAAEKEIMTPTTEYLTPKEPNNTLLTNGDTQKAIESAQKSLAAELEIPVEEVIFHSYQPQIWPDGSMGCRQSGKNYTPVEISGYIIRLQVNEDMYDFHGGMGRRPFLCQSKAIKDIKPGQIIVPPGKNE